MAYQYFGVSFNKKPSAASDLEDNERTISLGGQSNSSDAIYDSSSCLLSPTIKEEPKLDDIFDVDDKIDHEIAQIKPTSSELEKRTTTQAEETTFTSIKSRDKCGETVPYFSDFLRNSQDVYKECVYEFKDTDSKKPCHADESVDVDIYRDERHITKDAPTIVGAGGYLSMSENEERKKDTVTLDDYTPPKSERKRKRGKGKKVLFKSLKK